MVGPATGARHRVTAEIDILWVQRAAAQSDIVRVSGR